MCAPTLLIATPLASVTSFLVGLLRGVGPYHHLFVLSFSSFLFSFSLYSFYSSFLNGSFLYLSFSLLSLSSFFFFYILFSHSFFHVIEDIKERKEEEEKKKKNIEKITERMGPFRHVNEVIPDQMIPVLLRRYVRLVPINY